MRYRKWPRSRSLSWVTVVALCGAVLAFLHLLAVIGVALGLYFLIAGVRLMRRHKVASADTDRFPRIEAPGCPVGEIRPRAPIPARTRAQVWERDGGRCRFCGMSDDESMARTGQHLHYDHVIPFSRGGADTVRNLQLLCPHCNARKGARIPAPSRGHL